MTNPHDIELSAHVFPHTVEHLGERIILYAERDRPRISWRHQSNTGERGNKRTIPKSLGRAGEVPESGRVPALAIRWAEQMCERITDERRGIARQLAAVKGRTNHVRLGYVFDRVRESGWYRKLSPSRLDEIERAMRWVEAVLGATFYLSHWDGDTLDALYEARTTTPIEIRSPGRGAPGGKGKPLHRSSLNPVSRNTAVKELKCIGTVFRRARKLKYKAGSTAWLLDSDPNERLDLPKPAARRSREIAEERVFRTLMQYADTVDPTGRLRFFAVLVRWTGRRISTVRRFTREVVLDTEEKIRAALDQQLCDYVMPHHRDRVAELYHHSGGALYVRFEMVKPGQLGDEGRVEQYDAVIPVPPVVLREAQHYFSRYWDGLQLGSDAPLFPGETLDAPISAELVNRWWHRVELLAANDGKPLGMSANNAWHGFRKNRRTELRSIPDKYARWLVGHSVLSGTPGITVSEGRYLGLVPEDLARAVQVGMEEPREG